MHFTFLHLFLLLLGGLLWWLWKRVCQYFERQAHELFLKAQREEEQGLYAEACYTYGVALL
ncbi:MAG TPA: hypothetical protein VNO81_11505, partial [Candidatus Nitrosotenuis sp.]|nr:hypothetical protein [Candidatus Nitrosotenuis sp.]